MNTTPQLEPKRPSLRAAIRNGWAIVVITVLVGVGAATAYTTTLERSYTSTAVVLLNPITANPLTPDAASSSGAQLTVALETEAEVVATPSIAQEVSNRLGRVVPGGSELLEVDIPGGTQMVRIAYTADSAPGARAAAQSFAEVFLDYREERASASKENSLTTLRAEAEEIEEGLREALDASDEAGVDSFALREVDLYVDRLAGVGDRIGAAEALGTDPGQVLQPAQEPVGSNELNPVVMIAVGGLLGLGIGLLLVLYREWRADLVQDMRDHDVAGVPIFANIPGTSDPVLVPRGHAAHEAYRQLRAGVVANGSRPHVLAVAAIDSDGAGSTVAANLAHVLAEAQFTVLLAGCDPTNNTAEYFFGPVEEAQGLSSVLSGTTDLDHVVIRREGMDIIQGGNGTGSVRELYAGPHFHGLVKTLRRTHDYVILASSGAGTADGDAVVSAADSVLLVLTAGHTTRAQVVAAQERFQRLGIVTLGAVTMSSQRGFRRSQGAQRQYGPEATTAVRAAHAAA